VKNSNIGIEKGGMSTIDKLMPIAIVLAVAYSLYTVPLNTALMGIGAGAILYAVTKSKYIFLGVLLIMIVMKNFTRMVTSATAPAPAPATPTVTTTVTTTVPTFPAEGFQARDPVNVHTRIENVKGKAPLNPKVENITGVLESPHILDNTPLQGMPGDGLPGSSIPASARARVLIYPPSEETMPAPKESVRLDPKTNPYLQTGQDRLAEEVSMAQKGTDLYAEDSATLDGVAGGAGPAF
jgi:hypothetical protein